MNEMLYIFLIRALTIMLVIPLINFAKGLVTKKMGDDTMESQGRITLNPIAHLDLIGTIFILLTGFGWSKPLQINFSKLKNVRKGVILISLTGPVTHFLVAIVCKFVLVYFNLINIEINNTSLGYCVYLMLNIFYMINVTLGTISLIPIPPLDGFNILQQFAGCKFNKWYYSNYSLIHQVSLFIIMGFFFINGFIFKFVNNFLNHIILFLMSLIFR